MTLYQRSYTRTEPAILPIVEAAKRSHVMFDRRKELPLFITADGAYSQWQGPDRASTILLPCGSRYTSFDRHAMLAMQLGSHVAVCLYSPDLQIGAVTQLSDDGRMAGDTDFLPNLAEAVGSICRHGCTPGSLVIKVFGGANMPLAPVVGLGGYNYRMVRYALGELGLSIESTHCGGQSPRRVLYKATTGKAFVRCGRRREDFAIQTAESQWRAIRRQQLGSAEPASDYAALY